jgi:hypothetical protein
MVYSQIVAVCSESDKNNKFCPYRAVNTLRLGYSNESVNSV